MRVIAISGHAQNGKDTTAAIMSRKLEDHGDKVLIAHYADLLKFICRTYFGWNGEKDEQGRQLLQYVGTDVIRKQMPDYWVDFIISVLKLFDGEWDYVLIPDSRFPNEIEKLRDSGFDVQHVRVVRHGFISPLTAEQQNHPSETALDNTVPDSYIINDGTLDDLDAAINTYMKENIYGD